MRKKRKSRLEHWTLQVNGTSTLVRALTILVDDLKALVVRSGALVIAITSLVLTIVGCLKLL